ncbi:DUF2797 domain-containing protein [Streptomyces sp. NPDC087850]|uniref:DUF2797 domain-containing protein n=1 Tax=Streptomyces sp. NPDC087850 TaxID=3365809 RepID=UPI003821F610
MAWRCEGLRWADAAPVLVWRRAGGGERRESVLRYGRELGFRAIGARGCVGARGNVCPLGAPVAARSTGARCRECARLERAHSVAADTVADDPRTYRVYLAWFGPGMVKVGITAEQRGPARLLEQGAVAFSWLGRGPLMAARRTEELLRSALGVPDRIPYARKRAVRAVLPAREERIREIELLYGLVVALEGRGWPESLERIAFEAVDHAGVFGVAALAGTASGVVSELVDGGCVSGRLIAAAGPDLYLEPGDGSGDRGPVVLDTRLIRGWELAGAAVGLGITVPVRPAPTYPLGDADGGGVQDGLF